MQINLRIALESLERRDLLTTEFIGHFDYSPTLQEAGNAIIVMSDNGAEDGGARIRRLDGIELHELAEDRVGQIDSFHDTYNTESRLFFFPDETIWATDGTEEGTQQLFSIPQRSLRVRARDVTSLNDRLYFPQDRRLWVSDGTPEGTQMAIENTGGKIHHLVTFQNSLYFVMVKRGKTELWKSGGTPDGTKLITKFPAVSSRFQIHPLELSVVDDHLILADYRNDLRWRSDGTAEGTDQLANGFENEIRVAGRVFNVRQVDLGGDPDYWPYALEIQTDSGQQTLHNNVLPTFQWCSSEFNFTEFNGDIFFPATDEKGKQSLWKSDGTHEGTVLVKEGALMPAYIAGDQLILWGRDKETGTQLWKSDGTTEGTVPITDQPGGDFGRSIIGTFFSKIYYAHDHLYFTTGSPDRFGFGQVQGSGMSLWRLPLNEVAPHEPHTGAIDSVHAAIAADEYQSRFDFDENEKLDSADVHFLLERVVRTQPGDANLDRKVDFSDFVILSQNFGSTGGWGDGDFNGDGEIDFGDFLILSENFEV